MNLIESLKNYKNPGDYYDLDYFRSHFDDFTKSRALEHLEYYLSSMGTDRFIKIITNIGLCPTLFKLNPAYASNRTCYLDEGCYKCWQQTLKNEYHYFK